MTDREMILYLINKSFNTIEYEDTNYIEISNLMYGEYITFEFNTNGELVEIYS